MSSMSSAARVGFWREIGVLLSAGTRGLRAGGVRLAGLVLASQLIISMIALPVIRWLFREALRAGGMHAVDTGNLVLGPRITVTLTLIIVILAVAFWLIALQFTAITVLVRWSRSGLTLRAFLSELGRVLRKLLRPSSTPLALYLFVFLPLSGFGFTSTIIHGISIPPFISGELLKSEASAAFLVIFIVLLAYFNARFALTVPVFVLTDAKGGQAMRASWRMTRGPRAFFTLVILVLVTLIVSGLASFALVLTTVMPTVLSDLVTPAASPFVAAFSLGAAQTVGIFIGGFTTAMMSSLLVAMFRRYAPRLKRSTKRSTKRGTERSKRHTLHAVSAPHVAPNTARSHVAERRIRRSFWSVTVVIALVLGAAHITTMLTIAATPSTQVLGHRGLSESTDGSVGGVENTLSGLDAAKAVGAEFVEMDVMQTSDGEFIAMHDADLLRLTGREGLVKDHTLAELTRMTVTDAHGNSDQIPSFSDYVTYAAEIEMPLLIEIKLGGADTPDHVERLVAELEDLGLLNANIYHSLDAASVETLKRLRPDLSVGYTMPFAGVGVPDTPADFIVVEEWTATDHMQQAAADAGLGFYVWTVNEPEAIREYLRRDVEGIITDHADLVISEREEISHETGMSDALVDMILRFVTLT